MLAELVTYVSALFAVFGVGIFAIVSPSRSIVVLFGLVLTGAVTVFANSMMARMPVLEMFRAHGEPFQWLVIGAGYVFVQIAFEVVGRARTVRDEPSADELMMLLLTVPILECLVLSVILPVLVGQIVQPIPIIAILALLVAGRVWGIPSGILGSLAQALSVYMVLTFGIPVALLVSVLAAVGAHVATRRSSKESAVETV